MEKMKFEEPPEGIIVTVSRGMYEKHTYKGWLFNFKCAMDLHEQEWHYWFRVPGRPKQDKHLSYVYLSIGNYIRFRAFYAGYQHTPEGSKDFETGGHIEGYHWILCGGPLERAPYKIEFKGFRGFRYSKKMF